MKCPLLSIAITKDDRIEGYQEWDCLGKECAWWDEDNEQCGVLTLARGIFIFNKQMIDLVSKMPKDLAPRG